MTKRVEIVACDGVIAGDGAVLVDYESLERAMEGRVPQGVRGEIRAAEQMRDDPPCLRLAVEWEAP